MGKKEQEHAMTHNMSRATEIENMAEETATMVNSAESMQYKKMLKTKSGKKPTIDNTEVEHQELYVDKQETKRNSAEMIKQEIDRIKEANKKMLEQIQTKLEHKLEKMLEK